MCLFSLQKIQGLTHSPLSAQQKVRKMRFIETTAEVDPWDSRLLAKAISEGMRKERRKESSKWPKNQGKLAITQKLLVQMSLNFVWYYVLGIGCHTPNFNLIAWSQYSCGASGMHVERAGFIAPLCIGLDLLWDQCYESVRTIWNPEKPTSQQVA